MQKKVHKNEPIPPNKAVKIMNYHQSDFSTVYLINTLQAPSWLFHTQLPELSLSLNFSLKWQAIKSFVVFLESLILDFVPLEVNML